MDILEKEKIKMFKNEKNVKNIFMHLINKDKKDISYKNYNLLTYDQILCLSISTRFVF